MSPAPLKLAVSGNGHELTRAKRQISRTTALETNRGFESLRPSAKRKEHDKHRRRLACRKLLLAITVGKCSEIPCNLMLQEASLPAFQLVALLSLALRHGS